MFPICDFAADSETFTPSANTLPDLSLCGLIPVGCGRAALMVSSSF
ncbi:MAG: hypothetical protein ACR2GD_12640 [Pyrinomonadaceae bacterium]